MMHDKYDKYFEPATAVDAEGARIGLATCKLCGASVTIDPRDTVNYLRLHHRWHVKIDSALGEEKKDEA
jgi:hypothetical protein